MQEEPDDEQYSPQYEAEKEDSESPKIKTVEATPQEHEKEENYSPRPYQMEKSQEEILAQGYLQNFFECPYEYQKVIFMMVKGDQEGLVESKLYMENQDIFNYYLQCIIEFSQQFDPTETLMIIANDPERREFIHAAPDSLVPLSYITTDLWPKLGFLPIDPENPGVALIAEFMLNELILKNSESLEKLNLQHLKDLFSGEGEDDMDEDMDEEMGDENENDGTASSRKAGGGREPSPPQRKERS